MTTISGAELAGEKTAQPMTNYTDTEKVRL